MASSISESMVVFFRANGHSHDGIASSLIDTTPYSIYDFGISISSPFNNLDIQKRRYYNKINFESYILSIFNENITDSTYLDNKIITNPTITGGQISAIYFDFLASWNSGVVTNVEVIVANTQTLFSKADNVIMESLAAGNIGLYARLPSFTGTALVQNTTTKQIGYTSSRRDLKTNITPIINSISLLKMMNPVQFQWKSEINTITLEKFFPNFNKKYGFIVEDVENVDKALINYEYTGPERESVEELYDSVSDFRPVFYDIYGIVSILTASLKEAIERIEYLESQISG